MTVSMPNNKQSDADEDNKTVVSSLSENDVIFLTLLISMMYISNTDLHGKNRPANVCNRRLLPIYAAAMKYLIKITANVL